MIPAGMINAWKCDKCGRLTVARHVDEGVTPMYLACRASGQVGDCDGMGISAMYPDGPIPESIMSRLEWEWYRPSRDELMTVDRSILPHVANGGLLIRKIGGDE